MKKIILHSGLLLAAISLIVVSCVQQEYDIEELNTEMTIGAAGLGIPLGSTQQLKIQDFLDSNDVSILSKDESGVFSIKIGDSLSLSDNIPDLSQMVNIDGVEFSQPYTFSMEALNQDISTEAMAIESTFSLGEGSLMDELKMDPISMKSSVASGLAGIMPSDDQLSLHLEDMEYIKDNLYAKDLLGALSMGDGEISIPDGILPEKKLETKEYEMEINITLPDGIKSVSEISLNPDAKVKCSLSIEDPFLTKGKIVPAIDIDLSALLEIEGSEDPIHLSDLVLSDANGFTASKTYDVTAFNIDPSEWDGNTLSANKKVSISGGVSVSGAATTKAALDASENMKLDLQVTYIDMNIDNVRLEMNPIEVEESVEISLEVPEVTLPEEVKRVGKISISSESEVSFTIAPKNIIPGVGLKMSSLEFVFPEGLEVEGADADGVLKLASDVDLSTPYTDNLKIKSMTLGDPVGGKISYAEDIKVSIKCVADGTIDTKTLPKDKSEDMTVDTGVEIGLVIDDCEIFTNKVSKSVTTEPEEFVVEFPGEAADFGTFVVTPQGEPKVEIMVNIPETSLEIEIAQEGIEIVLPQMLVLKDVDPSLNYDQQKHSLTLKGELPPKITLPVKELVVTPEKDENGKYVAKGEFSVSGNIEIPESTVYGSELDDLVSSGIALSINIPAMSAAEVSVSEYSFGVSEEESFVLLSAKDLPKELVEISNVEIDETMLKVAIAAENLPDFGEESSINVDVLVTLPDIIVPNEIALKGEFKNGKFSQEIEIEDLDLSGIDFSEGKDLEAEVIISGGVYVTNPTIDMEELSSEDIKLDLSASISDIKVLKLEGKVDYKIDDITESVTLSDLPDFLRSDDVCLDIDNPRIVLDVTTNVGIPIVGTLNLVSYKGGVVIPGADIEVDLDLPFTESADKVTTTTLWIAGDNSGAPADVQFVEANLANIIKAVLDSIVISVAGGTDPATTSVVETTADYILDLKYELVVPLAFGEDMKFALSDTIDVSEAGIGNILKMGDIQLIGEITNTFPLNFEISALLLDSDDQILDTEPVSQKILPCKSDGSASHTPLKLELIAKEGTDMTKLAKIKVSFEITSRNVAGIPITEESYIQAKLGVNLPKGITLSNQE